MNLERMFMFFGILFFCATILILAMIFKLEAGFLNPLLIFIGAIGAKLDNILEKRKKDD